MPIIHRAMRKPCRSMVVLRWKGSVDTKIFLGGPQWSVQQPAKVWICQNEPLLACRCVWGSRRIKDNPSSSWGLRRFLMKSEENVPQYTAIYGRIPGRVWLVAAMGQINPHPSLKDTIGPPASSSSSISVLPVPWVLSLSFSQTSGRI